ncbi:MAG: hypothetical protein ACE5MM_03810, partial [Nitrospiraceae bacterium]
MAPGSEQRIQTPSGNLTLRTVINIREAVELVDLQRKIWGYGRPDADLPYPARALFAISESGGHVAVASLENTPVGFSLAWTAMNRVSKKPYLHSQ